MSASATTIPLADLAFSFIPVCVVLAILFKWGLAPGRTLYATGRMLLQLLLIGYVLTYIFDARNVWITLTVLSVMVVSSSWIALGVVKEKRGKLYGKAFLAVVVGGGATLAIVTQVVLRLEPWYNPRVMIPLAGMIFSNSMNCISLGAERIQAELDRSEPYGKARGVAFRAALIPMTNAFFAVGLVSLPGMMTGQILSGVDPLIAARYQIMVMCMVFGAGGISSALFLTLARPVLVENAGPDDEPENHHGSA